MSILYQTIWKKNLRDDQVNQIKKLTKLALRFFCLVKALPCNNDKMNMITKKNCNVTRY